MSFAEWIARGWLYKISCQEDVILELLQDAEADLMDARRDLPPEWVFSLACTSALNLCTVLLHAAGYRADSDIHLRAVRALPTILGAERQKDADYLEACFRLRQQKGADQAPITRQQAAGLVRFTEDFHREVIDRLRSANPLLVANSDVMFSQPTEVFLL